MLNIDCTLSGKHRPLRVYFNPQVMLGWSDDSLQPKGIQKIFGSLGKVADPTKMSKCNL